jgi:D-alanyl-D-alanine carboxypeptidase
MHQSHRIPTICGLAIILGLISMDAPSARKFERDGGTVTSITQGLCAEMKARHVLKPEAPVGCERLKLIKLSYVDFEGRTNTDGEMVTMDVAASHVLHIFNKLRQIHFPIARVRLMNHYDGDDEASMADNNTSAFNVRQVTNGGEAFSLHAYGLAVDLNPIQNPYAKRSGATLRFSPQSGVDYANRLNDRPGKSIRPGMAEQVVDIFAEHGFLVWGGYWDDPIDYQHFQVSRKLAEQLTRRSPERAQALYKSYLTRYRACIRNSTGRVADRVKCVMRVDADIPSGE